LEREANKDWWGWGSRAWVMTGKACSHDCHIFLPVDVRRGGGSLDDVSKGLNDFRILFRLFTQTGGNINLGKGVTYGKLSFSCKSAHTVLLYSSCITIQSGSTYTGYVDDQNDLQWRGYAVGALRWSVSCVREHLRRIHNTRIIQSSAHLGSVWESVSLGRSVRHLDESLKYTSIIRNIKSLAWHANETQHNFLAKLATSFLPKISDCDFPHHLA